jgi:hypothetical protein
MRQRLLAALVFGFLVLTAGFDPAVAACDAADSTHRSGCGRGDLSGVVVCC